MPFDSASGRAGGQKGGRNRWRDKDPATVRSEKFLIKVTPSELALMDEKAEEEGVSRTELIVRATQQYKPGRKGGFE